MRERDSALPRSRPREQLALQELQLSKSHALYSDASCVGSQSFEIADTRRQHRGTRLGVSHDNGVDGRPFASPSPQERGATSDR